MRVWLDPERIALRGLTAEQVMEALRAQNVQVAGGALGEPPSRHTERLPGLAADEGAPAAADEFEDIIVKMGTDGRVVRVKDVGRVELGALSYLAKGYADRYPAVIIVVDQQPGSNAVAATQGIKDTMAEMAKSFPKGLEYRIIYNPTEFIEVSINEALHHDPRGHGPRRAGRAAVPQDLARDDHSARRHPRLADRHLRRHAGVRLLAQHADAVRAGAGGRHRGRRRHRRGRERRAQAEGGPDARSRRRTSPWTRSARR